MFDVAALGELLIDFTPEEGSGKKTAFQQNAGGAPANVLTALERLGGTGAFLGKVGDDPFGHFLRDSLKETGVEMSGLVFAEKTHTTLAFVHLDKKGDRQFSFYGLPGADRMLTPEDLKYDLIAKSRIFHFGSISLAGEPSANALRSALLFAKNNCKIISFDPNWRPAFWSSERAAREQMKYGLQYADIVKLSEEEMEFLTGESSLEKGSRAIIRGGASIVFVTRGAKGCFYRCADGKGRRDTYDTKVVDTTGSGDAFMGAALYRLTRPGVEIRSVSAEQLGDIVDFANAAGALCATKKGAIAGMPSRQEVEQCVKNTPRLVVK